MHIERILPQNMLRFVWEPLDAVGLPKVVPARPPLPQSRQGWFTIGAAGFVCPTGAEIAATPVGGDGTRGILTFWAEWFEGLGGGGNSIQIAALDDGGPDAIPLPYAVNPGNALAGRTHIMANAAQTAAQTATMVSEAFVWMLVGAQLEDKFLAAHGRYLPNPVRVDMGAGTFGLVSPRPWRASQPAANTGAWSAVADPEFAYAEHPAIVRAILTAGVRPAPWQIVGDQYPGRGLEHSVIG